MNIKSFLYSVRDGQKEIEELNDRIYETEMSLLPGGIRYDKDKIQTSPSDKMPDMVAKIEEYRNTLIGKVQELYEKKAQAKEIINTLEDSRERQVLDIYFLSPKRQRIEDVAHIINYSEPRTYQFYLSALKHLEDYSKL